MNVFGTYTRESRRITLRNSNIPAMYSLLNTWLREIGWVVGFSGTRLPMLCSAWRQLLNGNDLSRIRQIHLAAGTVISRHHFMNKTAARQLCQHTVFTPKEEEKLNRINYSCFRILSSFMIASLREAIGPQQGLERAINLSRDAQGLIELITAGKADQHVHAVLADALEESGYSCEAVLKHLREDRHRPGTRLPCWAIWAVLGKHPYQK